MERTAHALLVSVPRRDQASVDPLASLDREWRLIARLADRFQRLALLLPPGETHDIDPRRLHPTPEIIDSGLDIYALAESLPAYAAVAIRTIGLDGHDHALAARRLLRKDGHAAALVARAEHLASRRLVRDFGPDSPAAEAAARDERRLADAADLVLASDDAVLDDLAWRDALPLDRHRRVPDFVHDDAEPALPDQRERASVLCVARLAPASNLDVLVRACAEARRGEPDLTLEIIGPGLDAKHLAGLATDLGLPLSLPGSLPYDRILERLRRCAVYVQPAPADARSAAVFEAMSAGCPVVLPDEAPPDPALQHGATALRVPNSAEGIAFALAGILPDLDWRELLGLAASRAARSARALSRAAELEAAACDHALAAARAARAAAA